MSGSADQPFGGNLEGIPSWADSLSSPLGKGVGAAMSAPLLRLYFPNPHKNKPHEVAQAMAVDAGLAGAGAGGAAAFSRNVVDPLIKNQHPLLRAGVHALAALGGGTGGVMLSRYLQDGVTSVRGLVDQQNQYYRDQAHQAQKEEARAKAAARRLRQRMQARLDEALAAVPRRVEKYAAATLERATQVRAGLGNSVPYVAYYSPEYDVVRLVSWEKHHDALQKWANENDAFVAADLPEEEELWVKLAVSTPSPANSDGIPGPSVGDAKKLFHSTFIQPQYAFNGPNPLTATVLGGLITAGLGYGAGQIGKWLTPRSMRDYIDADNLPYLGAMAGAGLGAVPGVLWGTSSPKGWTSRYPWAEVGEEPAPEAVPEPEEPKPIKIASINLFDPIIDARSLQKSLLADAYNPLPNQEKVTFPSYAAGAASVLSAAAASKQSWHVSPWDVAKTVIGMAPTAAAGMLGGAAAGAALGRTLGMLGALTPQGEQKAREAGVWAGLVNAVVPKAFGVS